MLQRCCVAVVMLGATAVPIPRAVHADVTLLSSDCVLSDSTNAMFAGAAAVCGMSATGA